ncbi:MAG: molybdopterin-dependent oxidoreductase, partial [Candidatus Contubernalis sp.]|nr:molybdopterin-dependent oxidoreductase [Candidatus Contubernalis sp.]
MLSTTASLADEWIAIKPGTDLAVCLAMINVIINEEIYNKDFVDKYCAGFEELKAHVQQYTPQWAASISEVPDDKITQIAREFAGTLPAVIPTHKRDAGGPVYANGTETSMAMLILNALVGSIDRPGGVIFQRQPSAPSIDDSFPTPAFPEARKDRVDGMDKFPVINALKKGSFHTIAQQILAGKPYPLKAAIVRKHNTMAFPNQVEFVDAMKSLDFIVVMDIIDSEFAQLADVVLPEPHFLEGRGMANRVYFAMYPQIAARVPVHDALYDTKGFRAIIPGLAKAMGLGDYFEGYDSKTEDDEILKSLGSSWDELAGSANGLWGDEKPFTPKEEFGTPSKKVELYATLLKEHGYDPLPTWKPRKEEPAAGDFTLLITRPPSHRMTESQSNEAVMELVGENVLWINPKAAQEKGISDGDEVYVESRVGKIKIKAALKEGLRPDCVATYHGFGHWSKGLSMAEGVGGNDGDLIPSKSLDEALKDNDPGLGACMNDYSVKVYKA